MNLGRGLWIKHWPQRDVGSLATALKWNLKCIKYRDVYVQRAGHHGYEPSFDTVIYMQGLNGSNREISRKLEEKKSTLHH